MNRIEPLIHQAEAKAGNHAEPPAPAEEFVKSPEDFARFIDGKSGSPGSKHSGKDGENGKARARAQDIATLQTADSGMVERHILEVPINSARKAHLRPVAGVQSIEVMLGGGLRMLLSGEAASRVTEALVRRIQSATDPDPDASSLPLHSASGNEENY
jgi:hypothetical protein